MVVVVVVVVHRSCIQGTFQGAEGKCVGTFFRGLVRFVQHVYSRGKATGKEALKTGSNILNAKINKLPEQPVCDILKIRSGKAKNNHEQKIR